MLAFGARIIHAGIHHGDAQLGQRTTIQQLRRTFRDCIPSLPTRCEDGNQESDENRNVAAENTNAATIGC